MKSSIFSIPLLAVAAAVAVPSFAAPVFQVTPSVLSGPAAPFSASKISGNASALLTLTAPDTVTGTGWVAFSTFSNNGNSVSPVTSGLLINYQLWTQFTYTTKLVSGSFGLAGSTYTVTQLDFTVYGMSGTGTTFNNALVSPSLTNPSITVGPNTLQTIGTGTLDAAGPSGAQFNQAGGTSFNANAKFTLSAFGKTFFTDPNPFYTNAFNSFTNTSQGFAQVGNHIALTQADGAVDFAGTVPEPSSLALVGLGLLGVGAMMRRRNS